MSPALDLHSPDGKGPFFGPEGRSCDEGAAVSASLVACFARAPMDGLQGPLELTYGCRPMGGKVVRTIPFDCLSTV